jgi:hypothetical protein
MVQTKKDGSKALHYSAIFSLISSVLILFFFTSLMMYDRVCYFESKMEILIFEWLLAAVVFGYALRVIYLLFFKKVRINF